jgi:hypothetical protein
MCSLKLRRAELRIASSEEDLKLDKLKTECQRAREKNDSKALAAVEVKVKSQEKHLREMEKEATNCQVHYRRSLFQLGVTLAHECFHVLTGLWTGDFRVGTPYKLGGIYTERDDSGIADHGEAGFWWEYKHGFNGSINLVRGKNIKQKDDPYPLKDEKLAAGVSFLRKLEYKPDGTPIVTWTRVAHAYIQDVTARGESTRAPQCLQVTNFSTGASDKPITAKGAQAWTNSQFHTEFESVVTSTNTQQSTATSHGQAAKATPAPPKRAQNDSSKPSTDGMPLGCKECSPGAHMHTVPLGCRGPKATESPRA